MEPNQRMRIWRKIYDNLPFLIIRRANINTRFTMHVLSERSPHIMRRFLYINGYLPWGQNAGVYLEQLMQYRRILRK